MPKPPPTRVIKHIQLFNFISKLIILPNVCGSPSLPFRPFPAVISILFLKPGRKIWGHVTQRFIKLYCLQYF